MRAVREVLGDEALLQVDANTAYTSADADHLARLDPFDLLLIEQPLADEDLRQHALLAQRITTPVCLDESVVSLDAAEDAIELGAASSRGSTCSLTSASPARRSSSEPTSGTTAEWVRLSA